LENNAFTGTIPLQVLFLDGLHNLTCDDTLIGSIPSNISTRVKCKPCGEQSYEVVQPDNFVFYQKFNDRYVAFSCARLIEVMEDPEELLSDDACNTIKQNCVRCG
jgi:hypothetical protein